MVFINFLLFLILLISTKCFVGLPFSLLFFFEILEVEQEEMQILVKPSH